MNKTFFLLVPLFMSSCVKQHQIQIKIKDFHITKMNKLEIPQINFDIPQFTQKGDICEMPVSEMKKIIKNNMKLSSTLKFIVNKANNTIDYYEKSIVDMGGKLI